MWIYIFDDVSKATSEYHTDGGLVVIAKDRRHAKKLLADEPNVEVSADEWGRVETYRLGTDAKPKVIVFPNSGCC